MNARRWAIARPLSGSGIVVFVVLAAVIPFVVGSGNLFFWTTVLIAVLFASSVNLLFGVADIPSFGQAAFFGAGGYAVALLAGHHWSAPLALIVAVLIAGAVAAVTSILTWRATGLAFAMLTLAVAQALYTLTVKIGWLGGFNGLPGVVAPDLWGWKLSQPKPFWFFTVVCVAIGLAVLWQIGRSPFGHMLRSIRENSIRATYLGVNVRAYRAVAFTLAGAVAGLAGGLSVYANQIATANMLFWSQSALPIIMLLLGGRYHFWGPAVGAVILTWLVNDLSQHTSAYFFYIGLLLLVVLLLLPNGILGMPDLVRRRAARRRRAAVGGPSPVTEAQS